MLLRIVLLSGIYVKKIMAFAKLNSLGFSLSVLVLVLLLKKKKAKHTHKPIDV